MPTSSTSTPQLIVRILIPSIIFLAAAAFASVQMDIPIPAFSKDVTAIAGLHPLCGVLSSLGILLWCTSASVSGFGALVVHTQRSGLSFYFLLFSAALSAYLLFDDMFLLHEDLAGRVGLHENIVYLILTLGVLTYLISFRRFIFQTRYLLLVAALGFLSASVLADKIAMPSLVDRLGEWQYFVEDGLKWIGIAFWTGYHVVTSLEILRKDRVE